MTEVSRSWWSSRPSQLILILVFVAIAYFPALRNGLLGDDKGLILTRTEVLEKPNGWLDLAKNNYWWGAPSKEVRQYLYRPWVSSTFWVDYQIGKTAPFPYHFSNYLVHIANTGLAYAVFAPVVGPGAALIVAALTGVCPAGLTSVGWIAGRTDLWAMFFTLLFLLAFRAARRSGSLIYILGACVAWFLALASKEVALVAPILAWLLEYVTPLPETGKNLRKSGYGWYLWLVPPLVVYFAIRHAVIGAFITPAGGAPPTSSVIPKIAEQFVRTALDLVAPIHYNFYSELHWSKMGDRGLMFMFVWLLLIAIIVVSVIGVRRKQVWAAGALWFGICLIPVYGMGQSWMPIAGFYAYLAIPGLWLMLVDGIRRLRELYFSDVPIRDVSGVGIGLIAIFGILTFARLPLLQSEKILLAHTIEREPQSMFTLLKLLEASIDESDFASTFNWLDRAMKADPAAPEPVRRMVAAYIEADDIQAALPYADKLAEMAPNDLESQATIARLYYKTGHCRESVGTYQRAFSVGNAEPPPEMLYDYALSLMCLNQDSAALSIYQLIINQQPFFPRAYNNIGICLENLGLYDRAISAYEEAIRQDSTLHTSLESLVGIYLRFGQKEKAHTSAIKYFRLNPPEDRAARVRQQLADAGVDVAGM